MTYLAPPPPLKIYLVYNKDINNEIKNEESNKTTSKQFFAKCEEVRVELLKVFIRTQVILNIYYWSCSWPSIDTESFLL